MGNLISKFCCIDTDEIFQNTNFKNSLSRNEDILNYTSSIIGPNDLPDSDIKTTKTPKMKIKSLSRLPISTKNVIRQKKGDPFDYYKIIKLLGNGTFGQVFQVKHKKNGNIRAMKIIPKDNAKPGFKDKDIIHEIMIMKNLDHPHIIKLYEFYIDDNNYYLINEFCTEGDLSEKMYKLKYLPEQIVKIIMAQIFNAVLYLNNKGIIHGDLKLENILIDSYLDNSKENEKRDFISSLIQDAKDVKRYLDRKKIRRSVSNIFNNFQNNLINENEKEKKIENSKNKISNSINVKINNLKNKRKSEKISLEKLQSVKTINVYHNTEGNKKDEIDEDEKEEKCEDSSFIEDSDSINFSLSSNKIIKISPSQKTKKIEFKIKNVKQFQNSPVINEERKEDINYNESFCQTESKIIKKKKNL